MKVRFSCDSGANIHSCRESEWMDVSELGYTDDEWAAFSEDEKQKEADAWAWERLEIYWEEKE